MKPCPFACVAWSGAPPQHAATEAAKWAVGGEGAGVSHFAFLASPPIYRIFKSGNPSKKQSY